MYNLLCYSVDVGVCYYAHVFSILTYDFIFAMHISFLIHRGRLDKLLYVSLPQPEDRVSILKALSTNISFSPDVDLHKIGTNQKAEGYSGADCAALLREAGLAVLKESYETGCSTKERDPSDMEVEIKDDSTLPRLFISPHHFDYAFDHVAPSVSRKDQARYNRMRDRMANARSRGSVVAEAETKLDGEGKKSNDAPSNSAGTTT